MLGALLALVLAVDPYDSPLPSYLRPDPSLQLQATAAPSLQLPSSQELERAQQRADALDGGDRRKWSLTNTLLEAGMGAAVLGDYIQTRKITHNGRELNPIMGKSGQRMSPNLYFPLAMAAHAGTMYALPEPYRTWAQAGTLALQSANVGRNLGLGWTFKWY